jgi:hypothetical protein
MEAGADEEAMGVLSNLVAQAPEWAEAHYQLAISLKKLGDIEAAREELITASTLTPGDTRIQRTLRELVLELAGAQSREEKSAITENTPSVGSQGPITPTSYLSGDLQIFPLAEVLEFLKVHASSGVLRVDSPRGKATVKIIAGNVLDVSFAGAPSVLDLLLPASGTPTVRLDPEQTPLGTAMQLVERGAIEKDALDAAIFRQVKSGLTQVISWPDGSFTFQEDSASDGGDSPTARFAIDSRFLLMEVLRGIDEEKRSASPQGAER